MNETKELILTEDVKKAMLGLMPMSQGATIEYTPRAYKNSRIPEDFRPVFEIESFTKAECNEINQAYKTSEGLSEAKRDRITRKRVKNWKSVWELSTSQQIVYDGSEESGCHGECYSKLTDAQRMDLFDEISRISGLMVLEQSALRS